jgi:hypothetical protein
MHRTVLQLLDDILEAIGNYPSMGPLLPAPDYDL